MDDHQDNTPTVTHIQNVFSTPWFDVLAKTVSGLGSDAPFYSLKIYDYVCVVALTEQQDILLVRQYRPAVEKFTLELPSGILETGENPADAAKRELLEETGYIADHVELLAPLTTDVGRLTNRLWCYFARNVKPHPVEQALEAGVERIVCSQQEFISYIMTQQFDHALHLGAILLAVLSNRLPQLLGR